MDATPSVVSLRFRGERLGFTCIIPCDGESMHARMSAYEHVPCMHASQMHACKHSTVGRDKSTAQTRTQATNTSHACMHANCRQVYTLMHVHTKRTPIVHALSLVLNRAWRRWSTSRLLRPLRAHSTLRLCFPCFPYALLPLLQTAHIGHDTCQSLSSPNPPNPLSFSS